MRLAVLKERRPNETRVAATPETVRKLIALGLTVAVETGAGAGASFPDADFAAAGAEIAPDAHAALAGAGVVFAVQPPEDLAGIPRGALLVCISGALADRDSVPAYAQAGIDVAAMELLPRITRAQSMDILSSQANLAGYRAVIEGANAFDRGFAMMMTAAGTVPPARVFVVGAGVAGLQAIATARRLGAIVAATDVRPAAKEEIKSLGASFVGVEDTETAGQTGAYAKEMSADFRRKQAELMATTVAKNDMVICTALVQGGRAPVLVTQALVDGMKPGSVVVDIAADGGGNCEATRPGEAYTTERGVKILGYRNWPGRISVAASTLYAKNLLTFLTSFWDKETGAPKLPPEDAIVQGVMLTRGGAVVHASFAPPPTARDIAPPIPAETEVPAESAPVSSSPEPTAGGIHAEALSTDPAESTAPAGALPPGDGMAPEAAHQVASLDQSASAEPTASGLYGDALSGQVHADGPVPANDMDGAGEPAPDTASIAPAYGDGMPDSGGEGAPPPHEHDIAAEAGTPAYGDGMPSAADEAPVAAGLDHEAASIPPEPPPTGSPPKPPGGGPRQGGGGKRARGNPNRPRNHHTPPGPAASGDAA
jgi:NAD(P) transhydrogenase subunit alpha